MLLFTDRAMAERPFTAVAASGLPQHHQRLQKRKKMGGGDRKKGEGKKEKRNRPGTSPGPGFTFTTCVTRTSRTRLRGGIQYSTCRAVHYSMHYSMHYSLQPSTCTWCTSS